MERKHMTKESLAALLNGRDYGDEISQAESEEAASNRLVPHATFNVMEDGEKFCRGIVLSMDDLGVTEAHA